MTSAPQTPPIRVTHVISGLAPGGAELALLRLISHSDRSRFRWDVVSLSGEGPVADLIRQEGVPVLALRAQGASVPLGFLRLVRHLRRTRPAIVQTWMHHADLIGGIAARTAGVPSVCWGLRASRLVRGASKRSTRAVPRINAMLSRWAPDVIVSCAESARVAHESIGYDAGRMRVIPNGFVAAGPPALLHLRAALGLPEHAVLIARICRWDPLKDVPCFLEAASMVANSDKRAAFVLCGEGLDTNNVALTSLVATHGLTDRVFLLGPQENLLPLYDTIDIACSSSSSEGLPNVVGESMAHGVPNVVTDVGDSRALVGDTGWVVPPRDPIQLADALLEALTMTGEQRQELGRCARQRILAEYSMEQMVSEYERLYTELAMR